MHLLLGKVDNFVNHVCQKSLEVFLQQGERLRDVPFLALCLPGSIMVASGKLQEQRGTDWAELLAAAIGAACKSRLWLGAVHCRGVALGITSHPLVVSGITALCDGLPPPPWAQWHAWAASLVFEFTIAPPHAEFKHRIMS